jgi:hypothetical protein
VETILRNNRRDDAIVMLYRITPDVIYLLKKNNIRCGMKGYPKDDKGVMQLIDLAFSLGCELVCVEYKYLHGGIMDYSGKSILNNNINIPHYKFQQAIMIMMIHIAKLGIWHLAWAVGTPNTNKLTYLASKGMAGVILSPDARIKYKKILENSYRQANSVLQNEKEFFNMNPREFLE